MPASFKVGRSPRTDCWSLMKLPNMKRPNPPSAVEGRFCNLRSTWRRWSPDHLAAYSLSIGRKKTAHISWVVPTLDSYWIINVSGFPPHCTLFTWHASGPEFGCNRPMTPRLTDRHLHGITYPCDSRGVQPRNPKICNVGWWHENCRPLLEIKYPLVICCIAIGNGHP